MNTVMYISAILLFLGWAGILIIGLSYKFDDDKNDKLDHKSLPKVNPNKNPESSAPK